MTFISLQRGGRRRLLVSQWKKQSFKADGLAQPLRGFLIVMLMLRVTSLASHALSLSALCGGLP